MCECEAQALALVGYSVTVVCVCACVCWMVLLCLCYPMSLCVAVYCCSMLSDTKYQRKWVRVRQIRQHYRYIFRPYSIENSVLYTSENCCCCWCRCRCRCYFTAVAGLSYMATPPIFSCRLSALSFSMWNIVAARFFLFVFIECPRRTI